MNSPLNNRLATTLDLAIGLATYDKFPFAMKVGAKDQIITGDFDYSLKFIDPSTGTFWTATSRCILDQQTGSFLVQFWDEKDTGQEAGLDEIQQQAIALQAFGSFPHVTGKRIIIQAIEWIEFET